MNLKRIGSTSHYGWLMVAASFCCTCVYGIFSSYGVFFKPLIIDFGWPRTITSSAYSIYCVIFSLGSPIMGRLSDKCDVRLIMGFGAACVGLGIILSSRVEAVWQLYLTFSLIAGVGASTLYAPPLSVIIPRFENARKIGLAIGISVTGTGAGTLFMAPLAGYFIMLYGWRSAFIIMGIISAGLVIPATLTMKKDCRRKCTEKHDASNRLERAQAMNRPLRTRHFWTMFLAYTLGSLSLTMVIVHVVPYAVDGGIPLTAAALTIGFIGVGSVVGRVLFGGLSGRIGERQILLICFLSQATLILWLTFAVDRWMFYSFSVLFGIFYGGWIPIFPILANKYFGAESVGKVIGTLMVAFGVGGFAGPLLAGYIHDVLGTYHPAFMIGILIYLSAAGISFLLKDKI